MKNNKFKILISAFVLLIFSVAGIAEAAGGVYVTPATATKNVGNSFEVSVGVETTASKVYAVEGTLMFNNLTCKGITVADGVTAQTSPTCAKPYFLLGIPSGTNTGKVLLSVAVNAGTAGAASISFTGVDIVGEGVSLGSGSTVGSYTVNPVAVVPVKVVELVKPVKKTTNAAPVKTVAEPVIVPATTTQTATEIQPEVPLQVAAVTTAVPQSGWNMWIWILMGIVVLGVIVYGFFRHPKNNN